MSWKKTNNDFLYADFEDFDEDFIDDEYRYYTKKLCKFCGTPSGVYILCKNCNDMKRKGLLEMCECGRYYDVRKGCSCGETPPDFKFEKDENGEIIMYVDGKRI